MIRELKTKIIIIPDVREFFKHNWLQLTFLFLVFWFRKGQYHQEPYTEEFHFEEKNFWIKMNIRFLKLCVLWFNFQYRDIID
jgi:hypothetical protein